MSEDTKAPPNFNPSQEYDSLPVFLNAVEPTFSVNNRLILSVYKKEALKSSNASGFALVQQKVMVKGLRVLADAKITIGNDYHHVSKGSIAYIKEEYLHNAQQATKILESEEISEPFIIVDLQNVEFIKPS